MFIGIDLGTTNSAITSFDGKEVRVWKDPQQQTDVTPSAIYINKHGDKYYGWKAYNNEPRAPENTAKLFKRLMGSNTKIRFESSGIEMTPEECSAEILHELFGYLPEEVRYDKNTGTVITVPAAFNQMQKDATKQAAFQAGINKVALIQEPVAAIMSVARHQNINGLFVVYDFGGGTFDISIAERTGSKINLLTNDGISFCGGRDFDKLLFDNIVVPWLYENFSLPEDFRSNKKYSSLLRMALWATEKAKIELSAKEFATLSLDESEIHCSDENGKEIGIRVLLDREQYNKLILPKIDETIEKTRAVINNAGLKPEDINHVVFVGGPTQYKPLRDYVSQQLGIAPSIDLNPMTAVSEGAANYAESVHFETAKGGQKSVKGILKSSNYGLEFRYNARTSSDKAKIAVVFQNAESLDFIFNSVDTGWVSGKLRLTSGSFVSVDLPNMGENRFRVRCFGESGTEVKLEYSEIVIVKTLINIGRIPCAHSVGVEIEDPISKKPILDYLIRKDDLLPKSGVVKYKTTKRISAGSPESISFKLWEGEIAEPIEYNRFIGDIKIDGNSFDSGFGIIPVGSTIECEYNFSDSGNVDVKVTVPSVGITLSDENFYNRLSGQIDYANDSEEIIDDAQKVLKKIEDMQENLYDDKLEESADKLRKLLEESDNMNAEDAQALFECTQTSKGVVASFMRDNQTAIFEKELEEAEERLETFKDSGTPAQIKQANQLLESARKAINANSPLAEKYLNELNATIAQIMFNNDEVYIALFYAMAENPQDFTNPELYRRLIAQGNMCVQNNDLNGLKNTIARLAQIRIVHKGSDIEDMLKRSGITK